MAPAALELAWRAPPAEAAARGLADGAAAAPDAEEEAQRRAPPPVEGGAAAASPPQSPAQAALLRERPVTLALLTATLVFSYMDRQARSAPQRPSALSF